MQNFQRQVILLKETISDCMVQQLNRNGKLRLGQMDEWNKRQLHCTLDCNNKNSDSCKRAVKRV